MHWLDGSIILAFIAYSIVAGFRSRKDASKGLEEYFLAGRSLKGWEAGLSMAATQFSADTPLLVTGLIATAGIFALWQMWIYALAFLLLGFLFGPQWRRAKVLTDAEFTELRYGSQPAAALRLVKAIYFGTIFNCVVIAWVLFAAAKVGEPFLLWDAWLPSEVFQPLESLVRSIGIPVSNLGPSDPLVWAKTTSNFISLFAIVAVTMLYSTTGGLRSVVKTDVAQFALMMLGTLLFAILVVNKAGGLSAIFEQLKTTFAPENGAHLTTDQLLAFTPSQARDASFAVLSLFALQWIIQLNSDGTGYLAQRVMACRSDYDSKIAGVVFAVSQVLIRSLLWIPLGLGLLVIFPMDMTLSLSDQIAVREGTYVRGIAELLPPGVKGLVVTAMLAALASTLDTHLNWGSSYWTNDIFKRFIYQIWLKREPSSKTLIWVARLSNLLIFLVALFIMTQLKSIQETWQISLLLGAGMGPALLLRWLWWRFNAWSEIAAIVASALFAPFLLIYVDDTALRLLSIAVVSLIASVAAAFIKGPEKRELLERFYRRVQPAGFWGPVAAGEHHRDRALLWRSLGATLTAGASLFCLLVGLGSWIASSPAPSWFPSRNLWVFSMIALGTLLVPVWIHLGFKKTELRGHPPE